MRRVFRLLSPTAILCALLGTLACTGSSHAGGDGASPAASDDRSADPPVVTALHLPSPAGEGSGEPNLTSGPSGILMSWLEPVDEERWALRFAALRGDEWSDARTIAESESFFVNWADFPSVVEDPRGTLFAHWLQMSGPGSYHYDVMLSRSGDGGDSWSEPVVLHRDGVQAEHGFVSLVPRVKEGVVAVWLDGRETVEGGAMTLRSTTISGDGALGDEQLLDARICDCCQTDAARIGERTVAVYRDRSEEEIRDIYSVALGPDGWSAPHRIADDGWRIPGCPVNGPAIAARGDVGAVAWFALIDGAPEVKLSFTDDGGRSFGSPILIDGGANGGDTVLGRVDVAWLDDERALVTWMASQSSGEGASTDAAIRTRTVTRGGDLGPIRALGSTRSSRSSGFPRMATADGRVVLAWTVPGEPGRIEVRELAADPSASSD